MPGQEGEAGDMAEPGQEGEAGDIAEPGQETGESDTGALSGTDRNAVADSQGRTDDRESGSGKDGTMPREQTGETQAWEKLSVDWVLAAAIAGCLLCLSVMGCLGRKIRAIGRENDSGTGRFKKEKHGRKKRGEKKNA